MKIIFFGTPRLAQIALEALINSPFKPTLVVTAPDTPSGRNRKVKPSPVKETALKHKIETSHQLPATNYQFDLAILVAFGQIIPKDVLSIPKYGFLNIHPSLLPKYRGPSPIQSAIFAGEKETGVTIIKLDEELDHGPIIAQESIKIEEDDTHASLIEKLGNLGSKLLIKVLPDYLEGKTKPKEQNHQEATYTKKITKQDGLIDLLNPPNPLNLNRMIRAFYPWPTVWSKVTFRQARGDAELNRSIKVDSEKELIIKLLPNPNYRSAELPNYLTNYLIQPEGKRPLTISEFKNGYPEIYEKLEKIITEAL